MNPNPDPTKPIEESVILSLPNISIQKMKVLENLSEAILRLARAVDGTNTNITVAGCVFNSNQTGLHIKTGEFDQNPKSQDQE
jgi:hypothetical protein